MNSLCFTLFFIGFNFAVFSHVIHNIANLIIKLLLLLLFCIPLHLLWRFNQFYIVVEVKCSVPPHVLINIVGCKKGHASCNIFFFQQIILLMAVKLHKVGGATKLR